MTDKRRTLRVTRMKNLRLTTCSNMASTIPWTSNLSHTHKQFPALTRAIRARNPFVFFHVSEASDLLVGIFDGSCVFESYLLG